MIQVNTDSLDQCWLDFDSVLAAYWTIYLLQLGAHISLAEDHYHSEALPVEDLESGVPAVVVSCSTNGILEASVLVVVEVHCHSSMD